MTYEPNPYDTTTNDGILVPPVVWMVLMCKRPKESDITRRRDEVVLFMPPCAYQTHYEPALWRFTPMHQPQPQWVIPRGFIPGSFVMVAYDRQIPDPEAQSLLMWDIRGQDDFRAGEPIFAAECSALR